MNEITLNAIDLFNESLRLRKETERARFNFIKADLQACFTFTRVADTMRRLGRWEEATSTIAVAEHGYSGLLRFFVRARYLAPDAYLELEMTFKRLRARLDELQKLDVSRQRLVG